jgi:hypothetical protein
VGEIDYSRSEGFGVTGRRTSHLRLWNDEEVLWEVALRILANGLAVRKVLYKMSFLCC